MHHFMTLLLLCVYSIDALGYTATKTALMYVQPIMCMALRTLVSGGILLFLTAYAYPQQWYTMCQTWRRDLWLWFQVIVIYIYYVYISYFIGMRWIPSANIALYYNLTPFIIALLGYFLIDQKMTFKKWGGLILGFVGVMLGIIRDVQSIFSFDNLLELLVLCSTFAMAYGSFIVYDLLSLGYRSTFINGIGMAGAGILAFITSLCVEGAGQERLDTLRELATTQSSLGIPSIFIFLGALLSSVIATDLIYYNAIAFFMRSFSLVYISFIGMVTPVLVAFLNNVFLHEPLPYHFFLSFLLVVVSFIIFHSEELSSGYSTQ